MAALRSLILVTGGARRLGATIVQTLSALGHGVIIHANRNLEEAQRLCVTLRESNPDTWAIGADLSDLDAASTLVDRASLLVGRPLSGLINSAAVFDYDTPRALAADVLDRAMAINLRAPALLAQQFAALADPAANNCIVNVLDQKLWAMNPDFYSYTISKAGLLAATEMMARAFAPEVRVNAVAPGLLLPSHDQTPDEFQAVAAKNLLRRAIDPNNVASAVGFLLTNTSLTGQVIHVDNGQRFVGGERDVMFSTRNQ